MDYHKQVVLRKQKLDDTNVAYKRNANINYPFKILKINKSQPE